MRKSAAEKIVHLSDGPGAIHLFEIPEYTAAYKKCRAYLNRLQNEKIKRLRSRLRKENKWYTKEDIDNLLRDLGL